MQLPVVTTGENKSLTTIEIPDEVKDLFKLSNNMEGVVPRLPQIKIIHRGQMYVMPDESKVEKFEGIILDQHPANAWWEQNISESGGNAIPNCFSLDGIVPAENCEKKQSEKCKDCPQNQFGSDTKTGKGKACKNMKRLHVLMEGSLLPRRLTIPPTSIKSFDLYMTGLVDRGLPYSCIVSIFTLTKKTSESFEFSEVTILKDRVLTKDEILSVANFIKQYKESARKQTIQRDEYETDVEDQDIQEEDFNDAPAKSDDDIPF